MEDEACREYLEVGITVVFEFFVGKVGGGGFVGGGAGVVDCGFVFEGRCCQGVVFGEERERWCSGRGGEVGKAGYGSCSAGCRRKFGDGKGVDFVLRLAVLL